MPCCSAVGAHASMESSQVNWKDSLEGWIWGWWANKPSCVWALLNRGKSWRAQADCSSNTFSTLLLSYCCSLWSSVLDNSRFVGQSLKTEGYSEAVVRLECSVWWVLISKPNNNSSFLKTRVVCQVMPPAVAFTTHCIGSLNDHSGLYGLKIKIHLYSSCKCLTL